MKHLIEISKIVTKRRVKKIELFDEVTLRQKNSKFNEFYEALLAGKFRNDRDASLFLYGVNPTDDRYRQLKSRFRKRLLNTLFFLDVNQPDTSDYNRAYYSCNKEWTLVKILQSNGANETAASQAHAILQIALRFKFADVIVNCARILREYASTVPDEREYELYDQYAKLYQDVLSAEIRSEELYQRVIMNYGQPLSQMTELESKIDTYCDALVGLSEMYDSPIVVYNMYMVWAYRFEMLRDFRNMLEVCERAEKYIDDNPTYYRDDKLATFQLKKMSAYLHLKDFKNGKVNAERCLNSFPVASDVWFNFMEYYFLLAMHTRSFINAVAIYDEATSHPRFKKLEEEQVIRWKIYHAYLNYIIKIKDEELPVLRETKKRNFRINKFLADPILYPRDQRTFSVLLVIVQMLFFLERKQHEEVAERIDRLKNYANRQLKKEEHFRAITFIRLLQQLAKVEFVASQVSNTTKYLRRLTRQEPFCYRGLISELEVIPYEDLWALIIDHLKSKEA